MGQIQIFVRDLEMDIPEDTEIKFDLQACNVTNPSTIQTSYSNEFELPETKNNQAVSGFAHSLHSTSKIPYRNNPARVMANGVEIMPFALAALTEVNPGDNQKWRIFSGNLDFFAILGDKSIRDLDFSKYDHKYNENNVIQSRNFNYSQGYSYEMIYRGKAGQSYHFRWYDLWPSTFVRTIWEQLFEEAGFSYEWPREPDHLFNRLVIPSVTPPKLPQDFVEDRSAYVNAKGWLFTGTQSGMINIGTQGDYLIRYLNDTEDGFSQGSNKNFDKSRSRYVADAEYFVDVYANLPLTRFNVSTGDIEVGIEMKLNGQRLAYDSKRKSGWNYENNLLLEVRYKRLQLKPGDYIEVFIRVDRVHGVGVYRVNVDDSATLVFDVKVRDDFPANGEIRLQDFLPDISQVDFIKSMIYIFCLVLQTDSYSKRVRIRGFNEITNAIPYALNWSEYVDETNVPKFNFEFGEFYRQSWFRWRGNDVSDSEAAKDPDRVALRKFDGNIPVDNDKLEPKGDIVVMPYEASLDYFGLIRIDNYELADDQSDQMTTGELNYNELNPGPRLLVHARVENGLMKYIDSNGNVIPVSDGYRPIPRFAPELNFTQSIIPKYWGTFAGMLDDAKFITVKMVIPAIEIQKIDHFVPIFVQSKHIQPGWFYLNKITQWEDGKLCDVELIRL